MRAVNHLEKENILEMESLPFLVKIIYLSNMTPVINGALRLFALLLVKTTKEAIFRILSKEPQNNLMETEREINQR